MDVDIKGLIRKLNRTCTRSLEAAAGVCVSRGHYEVTVEHLLNQLVEDPSGDVQAILRHFRIDPSRLLKSLQHGLDRLRAGNAGRPVFSPLLLTWLQDAWLLASVDYQDAHVRSGMLFLSLVLRPDRYTAEDFSATLDGIKQDELKQNLYRIAGGSQEAEAQPTAGAAGEPGAAPEAGRPGEETAIGRFTVDVTEKARAGQIDPVFGREREIRQMIDILARRRKNNPIVVGEPGVGKTAVVEGLALRIAQGDVPEVLKNVRLLALDLGLLQAGAGVRGEFENRLKSVIAEIKASPKPIVTFIDEAHTLIGTGGQAGSGDAANLLKPALARGELRTIAATTWSEYKKYFEKDAALERRFQLVKLDEPSEEDTIVMMRGLRERYEAAHDVRILDEAIVSAAQLASRYISGRQLPDKAVDLLDTASARVKIARATKPPAVDDLDRRLEAHEREVKALEGDSNLGVGPRPGADAGAGSGAGAGADTAGDAGGERRRELDLEIARLRAERDQLLERFQRERVALDEVLGLRGRPGGPAPRAELEVAMEKLRGVQMDDPLVPLDVDTRLVASVVSGWTGIPVGKMLRDEATATLSFRARLGERIKGQDQAIEAVDRGLRAARAGLKNPETPIGVFLFVGPSGVGKTECALGVADLMFGGERFLTAINMSEFQERHTVSRLIGSPPGYVGFGEGGVLTEAVRQRPYSVVLLDEVEKADPEVLNLFYQVFDKGMLSDGEGRIIDFKNTVIFLTSNLASDVIVGLCGGPVRPTKEEMATAIRPVLSRHFKPALLARMEVVPFYPLAAEFLKEIVRLKLRHLADRLRESHRMTLEHDPELVDVIANRCTDVESGARNIDHIVRETVLPMVSSQLLERMAEGPLPSALRLGVGEGEQLVVEFPERAAKKRAAKKGA